MHPSLGLLARSRLVVALNSKLTLSRTPCETDPSPRCWWLILVAARLPLVPPGGGRRALPPLVLTIAADVHPLVLHNYMAPLHHGSLDGYAVPFLGSRGDDA